MANPVEQTPADITALLVTASKEPSFWALMALLAFFGILILMKIPSRIFSGLDQKAEAIGTALDEARDLREQAQCKLAEAERLQAQSEEESARVLEAAIVEAKRMTEKAQAETQNRLKRREDMAKRRLARIEEDATRQIRYVAIEAASKAAQAVLEQTMSDPKNHSQHLKTALEQAEKALATSK